MEVVGKSVFGRYRGRRRYQRLETAGKKVIRLGGKSPPRRFWKIKRIPKFRVKNIVLSPLKVFRKMNNWYVNMMVRLAGNVGSLNTKNSFGNKRIPKARNSEVVYSSEEVEKRLVYEIYKALVILNDTKDLPLQV